MSKSKAVAPAPDIEGLIAARPEREQPAIRASIKRFKERPKRPVAKINWEPDGAMNVRAADGGDVFHTLQIADALGSNSPAFTDAMMGDLASILGGSSGGITDRDYNAALAVLSAVQPQNEMEALLAGQMLAANKGAMDSMRMATKADWMNQKSAGGNLANKFMRTFVMQMEALAKLRRGGEQIVKHVHVYEGGQAVVAGTINQHGGGSGAKDGERCLEAIEAGRIGASAEMPCPLAQGNSLSGAGREREAPVSMPWRHEPRPAEGE